MQRLDNQTRKDIKTDIYGLGDYQTLAAAHIIADALDRLTDEVVSLTLAVERLMPTTIIADN